MDRQRHSPSLPFRFRLIAVIVAVGACTAPIGSALDSSSSVALPTIEPSLGASPGTDSSHSPTAELTGEPIDSNPLVFTWTRHVLPGLAYRSVLSHRDRLIALGVVDGDEYAETSVLSSDDGLDWRTLARRPFDGQNPISMMVVDDRLIAVAWRDLGPERFEPVVWWCKDGKTWDIWLDPHGDFIPDAFSTSFARVGDRWLMATEYGGGIRSSEDGAHWQTDVPLHGAAETAGFAVGPQGVLLPVTKEGENGPGQAWMYYTKDGTTWIEGEFDDAADTWIQPAAADQHRYVAFGVHPYSSPGGGSRGWWSDNGLDWELAQVPDDFGRQYFHAREITPYKGGFVATFLAQEEGPQRMLWSSDGRSWSYVDGGPQALYEGTGLIVDEDRVLWFGFELTDPEVRTLWVATPVD
jgi:hypothetical protein